MIFWMVADLYLTVEYAKTFLCFQNMSEKDQVPLFSSPLINKSLPAMSSLPRGRCSPSRLGGVLLRPPGSRQCQLPGRAQCSPILYDLSVRFSRKIKQKSDILGRKDPGKTSTAKFTVSRCRWSGNWNSQWRNLSCSRRWLYSAQMKLISADRPGKKSRGSDWIYWNIWERWVEGRRRGRKWGSYFKSGPPPVPAPFSARGPIKRGNKGAQSYLEQGLQYFLSAPHL